MKVFWWQGGLHAEPETSEEGRALRVLYDSAKRWSIAAEGSSSPKPPKPENVSPERSEEVL
jgi:hypothetical protein